MHGFLLTLLCFCIPLGSLFFIGLPAAVLLTSKKSLFFHETIWVIAPFLGLAIIVLTLQNLIYLGVPIGKSFWGIWIGGVILWLGLLANKQVKTIFPLPFALLGVASVIYLLHSFGLGLVGPVYYVGHGWYDQFSYVSTSQFLIDHSLPHTLFSHVMYEPANAKALFFTMTNRIGEVVFQAFVTCSLFTDAKTSFEAVILILPFLLVMVIYTLARRFDFSKKMALFIAAIAGGLPSVALIHLESFLSQALITPLLLLWPYLLAQTFEQPHWKKTFIAALLFAAVISIYSEYYSIFLALTIFFSVLKSYDNKSLRPLGLFVFIILGAVSLNIGFLRHFFEIVLRSSHGRGFIQIYPWINSLAALSWLWIGEFSLVLKGASKTIVDFLSIFFFCLAYIGYLLAINKKRDLFSLSMLVLMLLPIVIWLLSIHQYGYQFYKLLISITPLFPLGIALAYRILSTKRVYFFEISGYLASAIGLFAVSTTIFMILMSTNANSLAYLKRGLGYKLLQADTREAQNKLSRLSGQNILISWQDDIRHGDFMNGWLSYFARHNRIWVTNSLVGDENLAPYLASTRALPANYLFLSSATALPKDPHMKKIWGNKTYALWR